MRTFGEIYTIAAERKGGAKALEAMLPRPQPPEVLAAIPEHRWLASFSKYLFATGLNWSLIEAKWPGFEEAFSGFDPDICAMIVEDRFDALLADTRIIRHAAKIEAVRKNAVLLQELRAEGGIARLVAGWPGTEYDTLLGMLKARGGRLSGTSGAYALRALGRDGYVLTRDVVRRLIAEGVVDSTPAKEAAMRKVQTAFNIWAAQSGRSLTEISHTLALSV